MPDAQSAFLQSLFANQGVGSDPALNAFEKTLGQNDYWKMAAAPILGAKFDTSTWNPATTLGVTAAQSFIGSLLHGYGAQQEAAQMDAVSKVLPQLYADPQSVALPAGVDPEAFAGLRAAAAREQILRGIKQDEFSRSVMADLFQKKMANQMEIDAAGPKARALEDAKLAARNALPATSPDSPIYQKEKDRIKQIRDEEDARRKEIASLPNATSLSTLLSTIPQLEELAKQNTKTSDIPFTYAFVQSLDGGIVKDGERYMIQGGNSFLNQYRSLIEGALNGTSQLTPQLKMQMVNERKAAGLVQYEALKGAAEPYLKTAIERGADAKNVFPFEDPYVNKMLGATPAKMSAIEFAAKAKAEGKSQSQSRAEWEAYKAANGG